MAARANKLVFQVSNADPAKWNLALNNARNVIKDLGEDSVAIEIVAYGPGTGWICTGRRGRTDAASEAGLRPYSSLTDCPTCAKPQR